MDGDPELEVEQDPALSRAPAVANAQFVVSTHSTCIRCAPCAPADYVVGSGSVTCVYCNRMIEAFKLSFAMLLHPRLGADSLLGNMPLDLVQQVLEKCTEVTCIPRGANVVPQLVVPTTEAEYHTYIQDTRMQASNGLWVSGAFRLYSDPYPSSVADGNGVDMFWQVEPTTSNSTAMAMWHDTDEYEGMDNEPGWELPVGQKSYYIIVQINFSLPVLTPTNMNTVDVTGLPNVQRIVANLLDHSASLWDYERLSPGTYCHEEGEYDTEYTGWFKYKRVVQGTREQTTMQEVWDAVGYIEGWGVGYVEGFFGDEIALKTVHDHLTDIALSDSDSEDDEETQVEKETYWQNGGKVVKMDSLNK